MGSSVSDRWVHVTFQVQDAIDRLAAHTSHYPSLFGVVGYVKRLISNAQKDKTHREFVKISETGVNNAQLKLVKYTQTSTFPEEFNNLKGGKNLESGSSIIALTPFIDHQDV
jgi:hypothetical protein